MNSHFGQSQTKKKIFVAGNHDLIFDLEPLEGIRKIPRNIIYLPDSGCRIGKIHFHALEASPWLHSTPSKIPKELDILLTHGPAFSMFDKGIGCKYLLEFIRTTNPAFHLFGHVHKYGGQKEEIGNTIFVNVCSEET